MNNCVTCLVKSKSIGQSMFSDGLVTRVGMRLRSPKPIIKLKAYYLKGFCCKGFLKIIEIKNVNR